MLHREGSGFLVISSEPLFKENCFFYFHARVLLNRLILFTSVLVVCSAKLRGHRQITSTEVGLLAGFLAISFKRSCFRRIAFIYFHVFVMPKSLTSQLEACSARIRNQRFGFFTPYLLNSVVSRESPVLFTCPCDAKAWDHS